MATGYKTLSITYARPNPESSSDLSETDDWIEIRQPDEKDLPAAGFDAWSAKQGFMVTVDNILTMFENYQSACEDDGCLTVEIQVHKSREDLAYTLTRTYGELSGRFKHTKDVTKSVLIEAKASLDLKSLVADGKVDARWEGDVFDAAGDPLLPPPTPELVGGILDFGQEVVGSLRHKYTEKYDTYTLTINPRKEGDYDPENPESAYEASVVALWEGEPVTHSVELPEMKGSCGGSTIVNPDDEDDPDKEKCYKRVVTVDPCDVRNNEEDLEQIPCPNDKKTDDSSDSGTTVTTS